jgi:hypothetical protein
VRVALSTQCRRRFCAGGLLLGLVLSLNLVGIGGAAAGERYFIDFRSRPADYIGHTFIVYGRIGDDGRVLELHRAGLIPEQNVLRGLFVPIRATVREYKDDTRLTATAIYHRRLTAQEYARVSRVVRVMRAREHEWHAVFQNCNEFGNQIADALGLWHPPSLLPPAAWVTLVHKVNELGR